MAKVAEGIGATVAQVAVAWVALRGQDIVPLIGLRHREQLVDSLGAAKLALSGEYLTAVEQAIPRGAAAGDRYPPPQMAALDSERRARYEEEARERSDVSELCPALGACKEK